MAFKIHTRDTAAVMPMEYLPGAAGAYKMGQMLTVAAGKVKPVSAATNTTPPYVCMAEKTIAEGELVPVVRVSRDTVYETQLNAAAEAAVIGTKLQVAADGVTASAAAAGTFEIVKLEGTGAGDTVWGRFG